MARVARNHPVNHRNRSRHTPQRPVISPRRKHLSSKRHVVAFNTPPPTSRSSRHHAGGTNERSSNYNFDNTLFDEDESLYRCTDDEDDNVDSESDSSVFHWEEEETLFDDLMDQPSHPSSDESLVDLIDSLQDAFTDRGKLNKQEMAQILVPRYNEIKRTTKFVRETADTQYTEHLMEFNQACKDTEVSILERRDVLKAAYEAAENEKAEIIARLKLLYAHRAAVWTKLQEEIDKIRIYIPFTLTWAILRPYSSPFLQWNQRAKIWPIYLEEWNAKSRSLTMTLKLMRNLPSRKFA
ncbi:hypothetical protein CPB83DRAFT_847377 [Crepidotus variabilis]|uniref:Uncharacterized protein n=1 Tax=Crepidotus variabilis TaxID=179855 RepID=A0A9P6JSP6_9AGAR|nr:hypothetical protein CPB83DRAFT_847377 [Crepidotus variabilis]